MGTDNKRPAILRAATVQILVQGTGNSGHLSDYPTVATNMFVTRLEPGFNAEFAESAARTAAPRVGWDGTGRLPKWIGKYSYP